MTRTCAPTPCAFVYGRCEFCGSPEPKPELVTLCSVCRTPTWRHTCDACLDKERAYLRACYLARPDYDDDGGAAEAADNERMESEERRLDR